MFCVLPLAFPWIRGCKNFKLQLRLCRLSFRSWPSFNDGGLQQRQCECVDARSASASSASPSCDFSVFGTRWSIAAWRALAFPSVAMQGCPATFSARADGRAPYARNGRQCDIACERDFTSRCSGCDSRRTPHFAQEGCPLPPSVEERAAVRSDSARQTSCFEPSAEGAAWD